MLALAAANPDWLHTFKPFGPMHAVVLLAFILLTGGSILLARRHARTPRERTLRRVLSILVWITALANLVWYALPMNFSWDKALPLQMCDIAVFCAAITLGPAWRPCRNLLFFWGLLLSSQGLITPVLEVGPAHMRFWLFWSLHFAIVGVALYDVFALGFRPRLTDLRFAFIANFIYAALVLAIDIPYKLNYGYIGPSKPNAPTIIDSLGPWPLRILWMFLIVMTLQALAWACFAGARRSARIPSPGTNP
ncbi:MAG: TIGR02206 family membrane protein [Tepidisphaera sp.]|nr:TIGR02206 family membrane protein [Tepidisphaera sp.]